MADISDIIADRQWIDSPSAEPMAVFDAWLGAAEAHELNDPNAMALATSQNDMPNVRMVLLKGHDARGFVCFTPILKASRVRSWLPMARPACVFTGKACKDKCACKGWSVR